MLKSELRKLYLGKRRSLSPGEVASASALIAERFFAEFDLREIRVLHTFIRIPKFNEFDTSTLYYRLWQERPDIITCSPRINSVIDELESYAFDEHTEFVENAWGIREPAGIESVGENDIDLVVVPMLCFDQAGHRVGYGKGYYDRFLARCRPDCIKVGVSLFPPVDAIDDIHAGDVPLDVVITPDRNYRFNTDSETVN
ncbi:MAG: 5-formyltetrahydrofolate cyclo-ligase [Pyrinomonadaceae bacterium]|nr:5-formyltetrahydrofolate cyclo-ligase [Pyrinomonadaceae bacterium]